MGFEFIINTDNRHRLGASGIRFIQIQTKYSSRALRVYEDVAAENAHVAEQPERLRMRMRMRVGGK